jgi:hypothetical protein
MRLNPGRRVGLKGVRARELALLGHVGELGCVRENKRKGGRLAVDSAQARVENRKSFCVFKSFSNS